jgi:signal transduction histidine kinase/CheY-like chemotaxis protein
MTSTMSSSRSLTREINSRRSLGYPGLVAIGVIYFALAKGGLALASINPSATPIWPPTGFALAAVLLWGYRTWPAIFVAAVIANATTAGSIATAIAIASGNSLEAVVGAYLINRWSNGRNTFSTPNSVATFALICFVVAAPISATIGLASLATAGYTGWANFANVWVTWWLGDVTGALVIAPVIVLWASSDYHAFSRNEFFETLGVLATAVAVGLFAFSPLFEQTPSRDPLGFLAILPLLWAALRREPRDTATVALVLAGITVWGTLMGGGPFTTANLNVSFLLVLMFLISITVPSLLLSADVAVRKKAEENLRRAQTELERKVEERTHQLELANAAKSRFLAAASHDLRQPLHALGLLTARLRICEAAAERERIIAQFAATLAETDQLFDALLDISKLEAGALVANVTEFPIAQILRRVETTFAEAAQEKGLALRVVSSSAWVRSDAILLGRIVLNLVSNAVRYTARGGVIVGCRRRGETLRIEVVDTGRGIPKDQRHKIFEEFYHLPTAARDRESGVGLGLAIVDRLCRLLDHSIELSSQLGKGSRFSVAMPLAVAQADFVTSLDLPEIAADAGRQVIVIEDDARALEQMAGLLRSWGWHVVAAGSYEAAFLDQPPDLIIADYHLAHGITGIEAIERLRQVFKTPIPALLISGDTAPERARDARLKGYVLLHKPVSPIALRATLNALLKGDHDSNAAGRPVQAAS